MHGLINKAIEVFVRQTYGVNRWKAVMAKTNLGFAEFEAMLPYDASVTRRVLLAMRDVFGRPCKLMLEDLGTFLVTSPMLPAVRRLLRFGGVDYTDFLHSLEDLPGRVKLAVDDLDLPPLDLIETGETEFRLHCHPGLPGYSQVMLGVLRAMADDFGTLAILELRKHPHGGDVISVQVVEGAYATGKSFELGGVPA